MHFSMLCQIPESLDLRLILSRKRETSHGFLLLPRSGRANGIDVVAVEEAI